MSALDFLRIDEDAHWMTPALGIITAYRLPDAQDEAGRREQLELNQSRQDKLAGKVRGSAFGMVHIKGEFVDDSGRRDEERLILLRGGPKDSGNLKHFLITLQKDLGIPAALFKPEQNSDACLLDERDQTEPVGNFRASLVSVLLTRIDGRPGTFVFSGIRVEKGFFETWAEAVMKQQRAVTEAE